jgi:hypothetical protein
VGDEVGALEAIRKTARKTTAYLFAFPIVFTPMDASIS